MVSLLSHRSNNRWAYPRCTWGQTASRRDRTSRASRRIGGMTAANSQFSVVRANEASCEDLQAIFGARGAGAWCQCQRYKLRPREAFAKFPVEERALRLRQQTDCGHPESDTTSGLVAYLDGQPVGWCAVEQRSAYEGLVRNARVPWDGRSEEKADETVWA